MKMSDYFALPVYSGTQDVTIHNKEKPCIVSGTNTVLVARRKYIDAAIYAINNHDRMVEDIAELKAALMGLIEDVGAIYSPTGRCGCDEKHYTITSGEIDDIKLLLAKLNQEGEE